MQRINPYLPDKLIARIRKAAEWHELTVSALIRRAVEEWLRWNDEPPQRGRTK